MVHNQSLLSLLTRLCGLVAAWYFTDLSSDSRFSNLVAPLLVVAFLIALLLWLVMMFHRRGISQQAKPGSVGADNFGDGGGD